MSKNGQKLLDSLGRLQAERSDHNVTLALAKHKLYHDCRLISSECVNLPFVPSTSRSMPGPVVNVMLPSSNTALRTRRISWTGIPRTESATYTQKI